MGGARALPRARYPSPCPRRDVGWVSLRSTYPTNDSQIQHQPLALAARAANHDLRVRRLLLLGQDGVAVLGDPRNHPLLAGPADAELAGIVDVHAGIEQDLQ